jgi:hypothetical protein
LTSKPISVYQIVADGQKEVIAELCQGGLAEAARDVDRQLVAVFHVPERFPVETAADNGCDRDRIFRPLEIDR